RSQEARALGQVRERSLQFPPPPPRPPPRRGRRRPRRSDTLIFGPLRSFAADYPAQKRQAQRACALGRLGLLDCVILLGGLAGRLGRARLPDILHEAPALLPPGTLDPPNGVPPPIEQMAGATRKNAVVPGQKAGPAAPFLLPDLAEGASPDPQHVLRNVELLRHFADGPECVRCFVHRRFAPLGRELRYFRALESALMRCLRIADGLNTITRRGEI